MRGVFQTANYGRLFLVTEKRNVMEDMLRVLILVVLILQLAVMIKSI
jgi:hypothetical protein